MWRIRPFLYGAVLALLLAACGAPRTPEATALLTDADLDAATTLSGDSSSLLSGSSATPTADAALSQAARSGGDPLFSAGSLAAARGNNGLARGHEDLGGWVAYVEQSGNTYSIRLVDLNDENHPERRGDYTVYRGKRAIQSVAVSRDGQTVAFVAESKDGDYDLYMLDAQRGKVTSTRTPGVNERDVSMSLDGRALAWQGGTLAAPSLVWFHEEAGGYIEFDTALWSFLVDLPLSSVQPSISGDGLSVAFVEVSGNLTAAFERGAHQGLTVMGFGLKEGNVSIKSLTLVYFADALADPSISYASDKILFTEIFAGVPYLSLIDRDARTFTDVFEELVLDHPFLAADGEHVAFSYGGDLYLATVEGVARALSPDVRTVDSAAYWARGNFTAYSGRNDHGTFVRPDDGSTIDAAGRTVPYHVYQFRPVSTDVYAIESIQDYDGYLNLYVNNFNPKRPERNLLASNDDWLTSWSEADGGSSRIIAELQRNKTYYIVTSACGAPGTPCGPASGYFSTLITDGATLPPPPAPPTQLPVPDDGKFNITLRFWDDSLTDSEKAVFYEATARWEEVIWGDLANIPNFSLSEADTTAGAPGMVGELDDIVIDAAKVKMDGPGGVLARAGALYVRTDGPDVFMPFYGIMEFDEDEFGPDGFFANLTGFKETILHEMGHVLGISRSFWIPLGYIQGNPANTSTCSDVSLGHDPRYLGPAGNSAWVNDYGATSPTVPIANTGGCGTADSHWREIYLQDELMTGYAQGGGEPLSLVTIGALADLGYRVHRSAADAWSIPALPTLRQVSPNAKDYAIEYDFTSAYTGSRLGSAQAAITPVDLSLDTTTTTSGCEPSDFENFPAGNIALLRRGGCNFGVMAANALAAGASAVLIGNQGDTDARMAPVTATFGDDVDIIGVPISYQVMVELAELAAQSEVVVHVNTDTSGLSGESIYGPLQLPRIAWHLAEELIPLRGGMDSDGNLTYFGD